MKKIVLLLCILVTCIGLNAQVGNANEKKYPLAYINNWSERSMITIDEVFDGGKKEILTQISEEEFEKVKVFNKMQNQPPQMRFDLRFVKDTVARMDYYQKLGQLRMFKIATFKHFFQGTDWGNYVILRVPYNENVIWDKSAKWDTVYFLAPEKIVTEIK